MFVYVICIFIINISNNNENINAYKVFLLLYNNQIGIFKKKATIDCFIHNYNSLKSFFLIIKRTHLELIFI